MDDAARDLLTAVLGFTLGLFVVGLVVAMASAAMPEVRMYLRVWRRRLLTAATLGLWRPR